MLTTYQERLIQKIDHLIQLYGSQRMVLLPILREIYKSERQISDLAMQLIADRLRIHPVEVFSVASFYSFLKTKKRGKYVIRLCRTLCCHLAEKDAVAKQLMRELGISFGETTPDGWFSLEWTECLGMCDQAPAMLVNDQVFTKLTALKVKEILEKCKRMAIGSQGLQAQEGCHYVGP